MGQRSCRYCQKLFQPSKFQLRQTVCSESDCQRRRRTDYHKEKIASDPEYREGCRDSPRKWRARNPGYWKQYRQKHPAGVERNLQQQKLRDRKRKLCNLANNTSAPAQVWVIKLKRGRPSFHTLRDLKTKEQALQNVAPAGKGFQRFQPGDALLAFLDNL